MLRLIFFFLLFFPLWGCRTISISEPVVRRQVGPRRRDCSITLIRAGIRSCQQEMQLASAACSSALYVLAGSHGHMFSLRAQRDPKCSSPVTTEAAWSFSNCHMQTRRKWSCCSSSSSSLCVCSVTRPIFIFSLFSFCAAHLLR